MESLFIQLSDDVYISISKKLSLMTQGHICQKKKHVYWTWLYVDLCSGNVWRLDNVYNDLIR